jgi:hypothetical protein
MKLFFRSVEGTRSISRMILMVMILFVLTPATVGATLIFFLSANAEAASQEARSVSLQLSKQMSNLKKLDSTSSIVLEDFKEKEDQLKNKLDVQNEAYDLASEAQKPMVLSDFDKTMIVLLGVHDSNLETIEKYYGERVSIVKRVRYAIEKLEKNGDITSFSAEELAGIRQSYEIENDSLLHVIEDVGIEENANADLALYYSMLSQRYGKRANPSNRASSEDILEVEAILETGMKAIGELRKETDQTILLSSIPYSSQFQDAIPVEVKKIVNQMKNHSIIMDRVSNRPGSNSGRPSINFNQPRPSWN